jgi:hypothetical protein
MERAKSGAISGMDKDASCMREIQTVTAPSKESPTEGDVRDFSNTAWTFRHISPEELPDKHLPVHLHFPLDLRLVAICCKAVARVDQ